MATGRDPRLPVLSERDSDLGIRRLPAVQEEAPGSAPAHLLIRTRPAPVRRGAAPEQAGGKLEALAGPYETRPSVVARRYAQMRQRRMRKLRLALALALGLAFPPLLAVYLVAWLVRRSKPQSRSVRSVRQGIRALRKEQVGIGIKKLQEAHLLDPSNTDALYWLGLVLVEQQRYGDGIEALSLVSERAPGLPEVETALLEAYSRTADHQNAIHHAQRLLEIDPYDVPALLKLSESFDALGRSEMAVEVLQRAPLHKQALTEPLKHVHYRLGRAYEQQGQTEQALEHYRRVYASDITFGDVADRLRTLQEPGA